MSDLDLEGRSRARVVEESEEVRLVSFDIREERWVVKARVEEEVRSFLEVVAFGREMP
jgi:hypothetical protein